ncbi:hypothetical protein SAMN03097699_0997 [Flavobacteriaceae bacterium MAR_2010_188]|nr:hypothetical protein SAMN03097699_0997 [Flavobacteriaceae bacterium MAR_2010_188]
MKTDKTQQHAYFQDSYRRSSKFLNYIKKERFELTEKGKVKYTLEKEV